MTWHLNLLTKQITSPCHSSSRNSRAVLVRWCGRNQEVLKKDIKDAKKNTHYLQIMDSPLDCMTASCSILASLEDVPINARSLSSTSKSYNLPRNRPCLRSME